MRSLVPRMLLVLPACACAAILAPAAMAKGVYPTITTVSPAKLGVGDVMTIRGTNFRAGKNRNVVVFKRLGARAIFVKSDLSTRTKLWVTVPAKLVPFLEKRDGEQVDTRFQLRVLAQRLGRSYTPQVRSPLIGPTAIGQTSADCDEDGIANALDSDDDNDQLTDVLETKLGTKPCDADSDSDAVNDTFEYESALDLNSRAVPYPGKRPYPNPLDGSDGNLDFDQDGLTQIEEYRAWVFTGKALPLSYSDGTKYTGGKIATNGAAEFDANGFLSDDEKDVDADGLLNWDELHGRMTQAWWVAQYDGTNDVLESRYPGPHYLEPNFADPDTDGDGVLDGADDQDHDGYTNAFEVARPADWRTTYVSTSHSGGASPNALARVQPFNPCKPIYSDACHVHPPFSYYKPDEDWASPKHPGDPGT